MKRIYLLLPLLFYFNFSSAQGFGNISLNTNPPPDTSGFFSQGTTVTFTLAVNGYTNTKTLDGLILNYGIGWDLNSLTPITPANSIDGNGSWGFFDSCSFSNNCLSFGKGFYYDRFDIVAFTLDGDPGNDFGDFNFTGNNSWTFEWSIAVDSNVNNSLVTGNMILYGNFSDPSVLFDVVSFNSLIDSNECYASFSIEGIPASSDSMVFTNTSNSSFTNALWSFGDGTSDSTNIVVHQFLSSGVLNICLSISDSIGCSDSLCSFLSICQASIMSVNSIPENHIEFFVYPNPVSDILNFSLNQKSDWIISDIQSSRKYLLNLNEEENKIDVSRLPSGIYFIKIFNNQDSFVSIFVKE